MKAAILLVASALCGVQGNLAPFITPCKTEDRKCLKTSAQNAVPVLAVGIPALGLETLDPMHMARIKANQAGLEMDFKNTLVKGLRNCEVIDLHALRSCTIEGTFTSNKCTDEQLAEMKHGSETNSIVDQHNISLAAAEFDDTERLQNRTLFDLKCSVTLIGDYKLGGRLLIMPIQGSGRYKIKIRDILVKVVLDIGEKTINGDQYWTVTNWKHTYEVLTKAEFLFQNLFNGQKEFADAVHAFANSNWKGIFQEVAPPIVKAIVKRIVDELIKFFNKVPIKDLAIL